MIPSFEPILTHVPGFAMVLARLSGLFILSPILSSALVPRQIKAMLTLGMTLCIYPTLDHHQSMPVTLDLLALGPTMAMELLIGVVIGVIAITPLWAVQLAGHLMGQQMGLGLAQVFNPAIDIEGDNLGQILFMMALALFLMMGGVEAMYASIIHSFAGVPIGAFRVDQALIETTTNLLSSGVHLAMRVSMPVMAIVMIESVAVGFLTKTLPSLNIMSFGFPVRIVLGIGVLAASLAGVKHAVSGDIESTISAVIDWGQSVTAESEPSTAAKE